MHDTALCPECGTLCYGFYRQLEDGTVVFAEYICPNCLLRFGK